MSAPFAFDPNMPGAVDLGQAQQQAANFMNSPAPAPVPDALPGPGTILPPLTTSSADLAAGLMARQPNAVVAVPPRPQPAPLPAPLPGAAPLGAPPPPAPAMPAPAPARAPRGGGGAQRTDSLEQDINKIGQQTEAGIQKVQQAKAEGNDELVRAQQDLSVQQRMDAQELAGRQELYRVANEHAEAQEREALQKARDYTIPDFWKGAEGSRVGSVISVAAGAISAGILGGPNNALATINKYTDDYFHKQKEKIDNLYKYAEQTGRLNSETRMRYAQELTQLQAQHVAVQQSIITRIESVKTKNQGLVDEAGLDGLLAAAKSDQVKRVEDYRTNNAHIAQMKAQTAASYASAAESRAKAAAAGQAAAGGSPKLLLQLSGQVQQQIDKDPEAKETFKALQKYQEAQSALQSGTGIGNKLVIDEITKAATSLGARPQSIKVFEQATGGAWERLKGDIQKLQTGNALTPDQVANVQKFLNYTIQEKEQKLQGVRERIATGMKANPAYSAHPEVIEGALSQHFGAQKAAPTAAPAGGGPPPAVLDQARRALSDPNAPPALKAKARQILGVGA